LTRASGGNFAWTGIHPYSLQEVPWDFLLTTESQDLGLTSHPKDGGGDRDFAYRVSNWLETALPIRMGFTCLDLDVVSVCI